MRWLVVLAIGCGISGTAAEAQTTCGKISQCPTASTPLSGNELALIVQNGGDKQVPLRAITQLGVAFPSGPFPLIFGATTPNDILQLNIGGFPTSGTPITQLPGVVEGIVSLMVVPPSYTGTPWPNTTFSAYIDNQNNAIGASATGFFFLGYQESANGYTAGINGIVQNVSPLNYFSGASHHGLNFGLLSDFEPDTNIWALSTGAAPTGEVDMFRLVWGGEIDPVGASFLMHVIGPVGSATIYDYGLYTEPGSVTNPIDLGALATGNNHSSQPIYLHSTSSGGTNQTGILQLDPSYNFDIGAGSVIFESLGGGTIYGYAGGAGINAIALRTLTAYAGSGASAIPACSSGVTGTYALVSDGKASPTAGGAYAAGDGAANQPVWCNASGWVYLM